MRGKHRLTQATFSVRRFGQLNEQVPWLDIYIVEKKKDQRGLQNSLLGSFFLAVLIFHGFFHLDY